MVRRALALSALFLLCSGPARAEEGPSDGGGDRYQQGDAAHDESTYERTFPAFRMFFSERARFELLPQGFAPESTVRDWRISNRARFGLGLRMRLPDGWVRGWFELQDVRDWGSEFDPATLGPGDGVDHSADGLDVRLAYGSIHHDSGLWVRLGRQDLDWMGRILGEDDFGAGRTFDAVRVGFSRNYLSVDAFYSKALEAPVAPGDPRPVGADAHLVGIRGGPRAGAALTVDGMVLIEFDEVPELRSRLVTIGAYGGGYINRTFWYAIELYGQLGRFGTEEHRAFLIDFLLGAQIPIRDGGVLVLGGLETRSGRGDPAASDLDDFLIRHADQHGVNGHLGRYQDYVASTAGQGLLDLSLQVLVVPDALELDLEFRFEAHMFRATNPLDTDRALHGGELDFVFRFAPIYNVAFFAEGWVYLPGPFWSGTQADGGMVFETEFAIR